MKKIGFVIMLALIAIITASCSQSSNNTAKSKDHSDMRMENMKNMNHSTGSDHSKEPVNLPMTTAPKELSGKSITITAKEAVNQFDSKHKFTVWTFNGSVPGPTIRLKQGQKVNITLKNDLPKPVTIHWHGMPVPISQDGVPGMTMNAVQPGKSFTYHFTATTPGTYWYHSHEDSVNQVDRGLYGAIIVEGTNEPKVDKDYTLMLDDWTSNGKTMDNMKSDDMSMYNLYTINGKSGNSIPPLTVKKGDKVRIRLINAGYISHEMDLHGHSFKVIATDGHPVHDPALIKNQLISVSPGERYDIEFTADHPGTWYLESHDANKKAAKNMVQKIVYEGSAKQTDARNYTQTMPVFDYTKYGTPAKSEFSLKQKFDVTYKMDLGEQMSKDGLIYTINGKVFPKTEPIRVKTGDTVKVTIRNFTGTDHPMHLHGHSFQILSKHGKPLSGSPIIKDTVNLKPGDVIILAFKANNPGDWMFHCHELHHAFAGMMTEVIYKGYKSTMKMDPKAGNMPE
jgi:FtsP/CotA-like multicopper oxidase with cupredoxin domain